MEKSTGSWLRKLLALGAGVSCLALTACDQRDGAIAAPPEGAAPEDAGADEATFTDDDVADRLAGDARLAMLQGMVRSAGLGRASGARTVFAPTNAAFEAFYDQVNDGDACAAYLTSGPGVSLLRKILGYHVVPGKFTAADIVGALGQQADGSLEVDSALREGGAPAQIVVTASSGGGGVGLDLNGGNGAFGGADVVFADVFVGGGVLHVVDRLLLSPGLRAVLTGLPADAACRPKPGNLVEVASSTPALSTLVDLVISADLAGALQSPGPFTVFAPSNEAFGTFLGGLNDGAACVDFLKGAGKPVLKQILLYHVVGDKLDANAIVNDPDGRLPTLLTAGGHPPQAAELLVSVSGAGLSLNGGAGVLGGAGVVQANVLASNGIAHVIDDVLLSPGLLSVLGGLPADSPCRPQSH